MYISFGLFGKVIIFLFIFLKIEVDSFIYICIIQIIQNGQKPHQMVKMSRNKKNFSLHHNDEIVVGVAFGIIDRILEKVEIDPKSVRGDFILDLVERNLILRQKVKDLETRLEALK